MRYGGFVDENCDQHTTEDQAGKGSAQQGSALGYKQEEPDDPREEKRARVYGLRLNDLLNQSVVVSPGKYVRLSGLGRKSDEPGLGRLRPKDLDDVKRWIGVPDELGAKRSCCNQLPAEVPGLSGAGDLRKLDLDSQRALHELANEYVHGDSRRLASYKSTLDHLVDRAVINGVFFREDIDIHTGAVLEVAKDLKILFARHIRIWRGGLLKLKGPTKIDCVSITGNLLNLVAAVDRLPKFATYISLEALNG
jgi:hypothetical protein